MSIERYFSPLPKDAPLPLSWKPPPPKRPKRGPGRPRKKYPPVTVTINDSDKENDPDESQGTGNDSSMDRSETTELEVERTGGMKCLYGTNQKRVVVAYAKEHSVAAATKKFSIPRTNWSLDGGSLF